MPKTRRRAVFRPNRLDTKDAMQHLRAPAGGNRLRTPRPGPPPAARPRSTTVGPSGRVELPQARGRAVRRMLTLTLWIGIAISVWLWWTNTPPGSVEGVPAKLVEAGRITGMLGGYLLLVQILLMSRVGWLERWVGANELMALHRDNGALLTVVVVGHVGLIIIGYAGMEQTSLVHETLTMWNTYEDMISAFVATGILVGVA